MADTRGRLGVVFNLGPGEIVVLLLLALIFLGPLTLPELAAQLRPRTPAPIAPRWSWGDWSLVCAVLVAGAVVFQLSARIAR